MRWWYELKEALPLLALGAFWLIFPIALIWTAVAAELRCERSQAARPACVLTTFHDLRATVQIDFPTSELLGATVEESTNSDGDTTYRLVLELERGPLPFTESFSGGRAEKQANAELVRQFVADRTQTALFISEDNRLTNYLIAGVMGAIFVFALVGIMRN